jgi:hypothetical protein
MENGSRSMGHPPLLVLSEIHIAVKPFRDYQTKTQQSEDKPLQGYSVGPTVKI